MGLRRSGPARPAWYAVPGWRLTSPRARRASTAREEDIATGDPLPGLPAHGIEALLPLEIRVHGRGGQGGVTCAKLLATLYADLGLHVQSFGDYGMERSGAPLRAFTRVDAAPITNRNKVYAPHHLLVLDPTLMGDDVLEGAPAGGLLLLNTPAPLTSLEGRHLHLRLAAVDASAIARRHGIGTSAVVIVNTAMVGAYARLLGIGWEAVQRTFAWHELEDDLGAARDAFDAVAERPASPRAAAPARPHAPAAGVLAVTEHVRDLPTPVQTGSWRTQLPRYTAHAAPCQIACPAGNDVRGFIQALSGESLAAAARVLLRTQALPSVCGRVCPAPCMEACNRTSYDGAVHVRGLERWIGDHAALEVQRPAPPERGAPGAAGAESKGARRWRVAVVGGGPAGLSAAFALAGLGHAVELLEAEPRLGGVLRTGIPTYRLPEAALDRDLARILALGVSARCGERVGPADLARLAGEHDGVVVATGLSRPAELELAGSPARLEGVAQGLEFLHQVRDGRPPALGGHVVVVGGGNTAVDCARTALRCGADRVTIVYRRSRADMPAIRAEVDEALEEGVSLLPLLQPLRLVGSGRVEGLELAEVVLGAPDASGRPRPTLGAGRTLLACDRVLLALGQSADGTLVPQGDRGNVWLAGDLAAAAGTVSHAIGHGRRVAELMLARLEGRPAPEPISPGEVVTPAQVRFSYFTPGRPHREGRLPAGQRRAGWDEVNAGLRGTQEARRCFSCGSCTSCDTCLLSCPEGIIRRCDHGGGYAIDDRYCKGCGMCVAECPRRAMEIAPDGRLRA